MLGFKTTFILLLLSLVFLAEAKTGSDYYEEVHSGEFDFHHYYGPWRPDYQYEDHLGKSKSLDSIYYENYFNQFLPQSEIQIFRDWLEKVPRESACPRFYLSENIKYMRYLYRLLAISYLVETFKDYHMTLYNMGLKNNHCSLDWDSFFKSCKPKTNDMKKFVQRSKAKFMSEHKISTYKKLTRDEMKRWLKGLSGDNSSVVGRRVNLWCEESRVDCRKINPKTLSNSLNQICLQDKAFIQTICSEDDNLYGMSYVEMAQDILVKSNIMAVINREGYGANCLERYSKLFSNRERKSHVLDRIIPVTFFNIAKSNARYLQGNLFVRGALKEFDDKGLTDFLFEPPKPKPKPKKKKIVKKRKPKPMPQLKPKPKKKIAVVKKAKPKPKKKEPWKSHFKRKYLAMKENLTDKEILDMGTFKKDLNFSDKMIERLQGPVLTYGTRSALQDMKKFDKLGTKGEPVRLVFLKYLIDQSHHQSLYNILAVIGNQFYVINDIDGKKDGPILVKLYNDRSTLYQWQIDILDPVTFEE